jgi:quercetin dioxygenase-like cupin family protein
MSQLQLQNGDVWRLPENTKQIQVLSGAAWITQHGADRILRSGDLFTIAHSPNDPAVVTAVGSTPVVIGLVSR